MSTPALPTVKWNTLDGQTHSGTLIEIDNGTFIVRRHSDGKEVAFRGEDMLREKPKYDALYKHLTQHPAYLGGEEPAE